MKLFLMMLAVATASISVAKADDTTTHSSAPPSVSVIGSSKFVTVGKNVLPAPPQKPGCYRHSKDWQEVSCLSKEDLKRLHHPDPLQLAQSNSPSTPFTAVEGGQLSVDVVRFGGETDTLYGNNQFSLQLNSNVFFSPSGQRDWVQFTYQTQENTGQNPVALCIWNINLTTSDYGTSDGNTSCIPVSPVRGPSTGDYATMGASAWGGTLYLIAYLPWVNATGQSDVIDAYAISMPDVYNLESANNWNSVNGGMLGSADSSKANFTKTCLTTSLTLEFDPTQTTQIPPLRMFDLGDTGESNNLAGPISQAILCEAGIFCSATAQEVSPDWKDGQATCYPQGEPIAVLPPGTSPGAFESDSGPYITKDGTEIHICPDGGLLIGVNVKDQKFLCSNAFLLPAASNLTIDTSTHKSFSDNGHHYSVHVCPTNSVMAGWNADKDWLACWQLPSSGFVPLPGFGQVNVNGPGGIEVPEPNDKRVEMKSCDPRGSGAPWAMSGVIVDEDVLTCTDIAMTPNLQ